MSNEREEGYREGYEAGYRDGRDSADSEDELDLADLSYDKFAEEDAYDRGRNEGHEKSFKEGYDKGFEEGSAAHEGDGGRGFLLGFAFAFVLIWLGFCSP